MINYPFGSLFFSIFWEIAVKYFAGSYFNDDFMILIFCMNMRLVMPILFV